MSNDCANPLLLGWLKEWMDEAQERSSKGFTVYKKAYQSMKACPLAFHHPSEAQQLNGLGPKLCDRLADKLKKYCADNGLPMPEKAGSASKRRAADEDGLSVPKPVKKPRKTPLYVPKLRSGAYALLMALAELDQDGSQALSKNDLIEKAQPFSDSSFTAPSDPTKFYTAWQSMKTLETKELVCTRGHPTKRYYLSDEGWEVALRMKAADKTGSEGLHHLDNGESSKSRPQPKAPLILAEKRPHVVDLASDSSGSEAETTHEQAGSRPNHVLIQDTRSQAEGATNQSIQAQPIILKPGSFDVRLVLDTREIRTKNDRDYLARELQKFDVVPEIRALPLGDVLWIAKIREPHQREFKISNAGDEEEGSTEIVLEHVVERKRLDDLISSIKDGRFHEQKFRLRKSGMRNIVYLIEDYSISAERSDKYGEAVESAITTMQVVNDVFVKQTTKIDDTIQYLARMTKMLKSSYEQKELHIIPSRTLDVATYLNSLGDMRAREAGKSFCITFSAFCSLCDKSDSMTLRDVFLKMLMCTRGVTGDKAVEIQKIWNTPSALIDAYEKLGDDAKKKECLISDRLGGINTIARKKVAKALSAKIAEVWAGS